MNIYWYESGDGAVRHAIAAHSEERAHELLRRNELDMDPEDFTLAGVSQDVEKSEGALALGTENDTVVFAAPRDKDPDYDQRSSESGLEDDSEE